MSRLGRPGLARLGGETGQDSGRRQKQTTIKINGVDKDLVAKIAADIKNLKPVEPYKAKGIREKGQFILRKEGKKK